MGVLIGNGPPPNALVFWVLDPYFVPFWNAVEILEHGA